MFYEDSPSSAWLNIELTSTNEPTTPLLFQDFKSGQPNHPNETCVAMEINTERHEWLDEDCDQKRPYICQAIRKYQRYDCNLFIHANVLGNNCYPLGKC